MEAISFSLELIGTINDMVEKYGANKKAVQELELTMNLIGRLYAPIKGKYVRKYYYLFYFFSIPCIPPHILTVYHYVCVFFIRSLHMPYK